MLNFTELDEIYSKKIISYGDGTFECPVCGKEYKTQKGIDRHYAQRDCHSAKDVFSADKYVTDFYKLYIQVSSLSPKEKRGYTKNQFRNNKRAYNSVANYYWYCYQNKIQDYYDYIEYILMNASMSTPVMAFNVAQNDRLLKDYRRYKISHITFEESETFYNRNQSRIPSDTNFLLRALERGEIGIHHLNELFDVDAMMSGFSEIEDERLQSVIDIFQGVS